MWKHAHTCVREHIKAEIQKDIHTHTQPNIRLCVCMCRKTESVAVTDWPQYCLNLNSHENHHTGVSPKKVYHDYRVYTA